jgi:hypothetical protein
MAFFRWRYWWGTIVIVMDKDFSNRSIQRRNIACVYLFKQANTFKLKVKQVSPVHEQMIATVVCIFALLEHN